MTLSRSANKERSSASRGFQHFDAEPCVHHQADPEEPECAGTVNARAHEHRQVEGTEAKIVVCYLPAAVGVEVADKGQQNPAGYDLWPEAWVAVVSRVVLLPEKASERTPHFARGRNKESA